MPLSSLPVKPPPVPETGWRRTRNAQSLSEVFGTIAVRPQGSTFKKLLAFLGPGYLVAVGYMDPGNWATSLAGGSKFGYALLTIALLSNMMAILLQALCARLGIGAGRDLAQACRDAFPRAVSSPLWVLTEVAICATDLAEVIGTAIGLNLLFNIPLEIGVIITALDVFLILWMQNLGFRWIEAFIVTLMGIIALCFAIQIAMANPEWGAVIRGFAPTTEILSNPDMLYLAIGIIGATVMPHNVYLHSGVVQTHRFGDSVPEKREAIKLATIDSTIALMFALIINAAILVLAAATFNKIGQTDLVEGRGRQNQNRGIDNKREHQSDGGIDGGELDRLALFRDAIAEAAGLHHARVQVKIVRHHRGADDTDGEIEHIGIAHNLGGRRKAADHRAPIWIGHRDLDGETQRDNAQQRDNESLHPPEAQILHP